MALVLRTNLLYNLDLTVEQIRDEIDKAERQNLVSPNEKRDLRGRLRDSRKDIKEVITDLAKLTTRKVP